MKQGFRKATTKLGFL